MLTKVITTTEEFYNLKKDWERLQVQDSDVTYYSTFEFAKAWWDAYKNDIDKNLFIICIYQGKDIVGIAPFIIQNRNKKFISWNELRFLGRGDFLGILVNRDSNNEMTIVKYIFKYIEENKDQWDRMDLTHIKQNTVLSTYLLKSNQYNKKFNYLTECPRIILDKYASYDEYKRMCLPAKATKYRNKLQKEVGYKFKVVIGSNEKLFHEISLIHKKEQSYLLTKKNRKERSSLFNDRKTNQYLKDLYTDNDNIITFLLINNNDEIITYNTCYFYNKVLYSWNQGYNPSYSRYRVTKVRMIEIINYLFESKVSDMFDFGAGRYPWKFEWTSDFNLIYQLDIWNKETKKGELLNKLKLLSELKEKFIG